MPNPLNFLRLYRKHSPLTQSDIACLMELPSCSNISRCEKGQRKPSIELLLVYHLLFNTSIESFFEPHSENIKSSLIKQIERLISEIKKKDNIPKNTSIIKFLEQVLKRLKVIRNFVVIAGAGAHV